jgi:hypothetical protein
LEDKTPNVWKYKPWWCQPWSILLTGAVILVGGWKLTHNVWLVLGLSTLISLWWGYFLLLYPYLFKQAVIVEVSKNEPKDGGCQHLVE